MNTATRVTSSCSHTKQISPAIPGLSREGGEDCQKATRLHRHNATPDYHHRDGRLAAAGTRTVRVTTSEFAEDDGPSGGWCRASFTGIEGLKGHFDLKLANQTRTMLLAMLACMVTTWAGMLAGFLTLASMING